MGSGENLEKCDSVEGPAEEEIKDADSIWTCLEKLTAPSHSSRPGWD